MMNMKSFVVIMAIMAVMVSTTMATGECNQYGRCPPGYCCSRYGYCGVGRAYCGAAEEQVLEAHLNATDVPQKARKIPAAGAKPAAP